MGGGLAIPDAEAALADTAASEVKKTLEYGCTGDPSGAGVVDAIPGFADMLEADKAGVLALAKTIALAAFRRVAADPVPGAWVNVSSFANSWVNVGAPYANAGHYVDSHAGRVYLRGQIKGGTVGAAAFTLPVGARPPTQHRQVTVAGAQAGTVVGYVDITTAGVVTVYGGNVWLALDGITFRL